MLRKQDCTETIWGHIVHQCGDLAKAPSAPFPHSFSQASWFSSCPFQCGQSATRWQNPHPNSTSFNLLHLWKQVQFQGTLIYIITWFGPPNTSLMWQDTHWFLKKLLLAKVSTGLKSDGEFSTPDRSKSGLVCLIFNPTPQSILTTIQMGKWQKEVICLRSHTHAKHYHIITCSCKMIPIKYKVASWWKEQPGMGDLTHHQCQTCHWNTTPRNTFQNI